jgi:hypothetical protein
VKRPIFAAMPFGSSQKTNETTAGMKAVIESSDESLTGVQKSENGWRPRQVLLFSGHMIDAPDRPTPRFPADKEGIAAQKIAEILESLSAEPEDLALTQGANGGDILFAEACLARGVKLILLQPFDEPMFIQKSVIIRGTRWKERYLNIKPHVHIKSAPVELGALPENVDPYERCNLWLLDTALAYGVDKVRFICLWNGAGSNDPGGTAHMVNEVKSSKGQVYWLDTRKLW